MDEIADRIRRARKAKGIPQRELARRVGRSGSAVAQWELGQTVPDLDIRPALSEVLGIPLELLMPEFETEAAKAAVPDPGSLAAARLLSLFPRELREAILLQIGTTADSLGLRPGRPPGKK